MKEKWRSIAVRNVTLPSLLGHFPSGKVEREGGQFVECQLILPHPKSEKHDRGGGGRFISARFVIRPGLNQRQPSRKKRYQAKRSCQLQR